MTGNHFPPPMPPQDPGFGNTGGQDEFRSGASRGRLSSLAVASLILGILGFCIPFIGIVGLILGIVALLSINKSAGQLRGWGLALAGTITSGVTLVLLPLLLVAMLMPVLSAARLAARQSQTLSDIHSIGMGVNMYTADNKDRIPDDIAVIVRDYLNADAKLCVAPTSGKTIPPDYNTWPQEKQDQWIRRNSSFILIPGQGRKISEISDASTMVVLVENPADAAGGLEAVGYLDGHARMLGAGEARALVEKQTGKTLEELIARQADYVPSGVGTPN